MLWSVKIQFVSGRCRPPVVYGRSVSKCMRCMKDDSRKLKINNPWIKQKISTVNAELVWASLHTHTHTSQEHTCERRCCNLYASFVRRISPIGRPPHCATHCLYLMQIEWNGRERGGGGEGIEAERRGKKIITNTKSWSTWSLPSSWSISSVCHRGQSSEQRTTALRENAHCTREITFWMQCAHMNRCGKCSRAALLQQEWTLFYPTPTIVTKIIK